MASKYTESTTVCYSNPLITPEMAAEIGKHIFGLTYTPCRLTIRGRPHQTAGDIIRAYDSNGDVHNVLVMEQTLVITGGLKSTISCPGEVSDEVEFYSSSPTGQQIQQINTASVDQLKAYANEVAAQAYAEAKAYADKLFAGGVSVPDGNEVSY